MRKRLIYRCDDIGYSQTYDLGIFDVLESGIGCSADVMFDSMHAIESLKKLKDMPWISVGWHRHLWEKPVLSPDLVPSMVDDNGRFKWGHRKNHLKAEVTYEDAYREFEAEIKLCYDALGRYPDVASVSHQDIPMEKAFIDICNKYGVIIDYYFANHPLKQRRDESDEEFVLRKKIFNKLPSEKWEEKHIVSCPILMGDCYDLKKFDEYNPLAVMTDLKWTEKEEIYFYGWHPGFLDAHIFTESSSNIHRVKEYIDALSDEYRNWIIDNHIELINFKDALFDTNEYQDHLKEINSPLWIGNMK